MVAEGAEDQATVDLLTNLGCDLVQGYYFSRPVPPDLLESWLHGFHLSSGKALAQVEC